MLNLELFLAQKDVRLKWTNYPHTNSDQTIQKIRTVVDTTAVNSRTYSRVGRLGAVVAVHDCIACCAYEVFYWSRYRMLATPYCSLDSRYATQPRELPETQVPCAAAAIGRASLARENEAGGSWGLEVHILHVNI